MASRLSDSTSPYLRAHADNPVAWFPWGDEAFAEARRRDVPVLVSIGYSTCHWCHVMARESFADPLTAGELNAAFVAIKVDREEHPEVDAAYMAAAGAFSQNLGWPLTVFATPEGRPFYAGTYFPPQPRGGLPAFRQVLAAVSEAWTQRRDQVDGTAGALVSALAEAGARPGGESVPTLDELTAAARAVAAREDPEYGGFWGGDPAAPKFPIATALRFLQAPGVRVAAPEASLVADRALAAMSASDLRDRVEGGFFRYATRRDWSVPHYERMLTDNAQLLEVALDAGVFGGGVLDTGGPGTAALGTSGPDTAAVGTSGPDTAAIGTGGPDTAALGTAALATAAHGTAAHATAAHGTAALDTARGITAFLTGVLQQPTGGFGAAQDSESWIDGARSEGGYYARDAAARAALDPPAVDGKVVTGWNGLAIGALARAGLVLRESSMLEAARWAADAVLEANVAADGRLVRASLDEIASRAPATLADYGQLAGGLVALAAAIGEVAYAVRARELVDACVGEGGAVAVPGGGDPLLAAQGVVAPDAASDGDEPSGPAAIAAAALALWTLGSGEAYRALAERIVVAHAGTALAQPLAHGALLRVAVGLATAPRQVVVVTPGDRVDDPLVAAAGGIPSSDVFSVVSPTQAEALAAAGFGLYEGKGAVEGRATAYDCRDFACRLPVTDPAGL